MRVVIWMTLKCRPDKSVKVSLTTCVSPKIILCHTMELNERVSEAYNADIGHLELNQQNYAIAVLYVFEAWYDSSGTMKDGKELMLQMCYVQISLVGKTKK